MTFVLASRNKKKITELRVLLSQYLDDVEILSPDDIGFIEDIEETGKTFAENALIKAGAVAKKGYIGIADDSGICVDALDGAPGIYSARYAFVCTGKDDHNDQRNNEVLLANLQNVPSDKRTAHYACAFACVFPDGRSFTVEDKVEGLIIDDPHGENGFGYDPYFYYPPLHATFAEIPMAEKNKISHRGKAIVAFAKALKDWISK